MSLADEVRSVAEALLACRGPELAEVLNSSLQSLLPWPFTASSGILQDLDGSRMGPFPTVIHTTTSTYDPGRPFSADAVAAVIDVHETLDIEALRNSYQRISQVKTLRKSPPPRIDFPVQTVTMGIVLGQRSSIPLDSLADELDRLNRTTPGRQWADMVAVLTTGTIHYATHFPGEGLLADLIPTAEGALESYIPPNYDVMVMAPTSAATFNNMLGNLMGHLFFFSPGTKFPNRDELFAGMSRRVITLTGYQYNLKGELLPVPRQFYNDRYIPPPPMRVEAQSGELLCTLQYIPWQDGGVILLKGKPILSGFLPFLGEKGLKKSGIVTLPDGQVSYVLPITKDDFRDMLGRIQRQSNLIVRKEEPAWVWVKDSNEGTGTPFFARLSLGVLRLRDLVFTDSDETQRFDTYFETIYESLRSARAAASEVCRKWTEHARKVASGEIAQMRGKSILVSEPIDRELRDEFESFLNAAARAFKQGMQDLAKHLRIDIGFLYKPHGPFQAGLETLRTRDPLLAEYLQHTRTWSHVLMCRRNALEHEGWRLPRVTYSAANDRIVPAEPLVADRTLCEFVTFMLDRLLCFSEEVTAHCLQALMPSELTISEIVISRRSPQASERFTPTLSAGGLPPWRISYHVSTFDDT